MRLQTPPFYNELRPSGTGGLGSPRAVGKRALDRSATSSKDCLSIRDRCID